MMIKLKYTGYILSACLLATNLQAKHGIDLYDNLKYGSGFTHVDYANPDAPKGGDIAMGAVGNFDSLNPFTEKGQPAAGMAPIHPSYPYATLLKHSYDEPIAAYGYIAKDVEVVDDGFGVVFTLREEAKFHDTSPITPDDVVFTFNTLKAKGHLFYRQYYNDIIKAEKISKTKVKFIFKNNINRELPIIIGEMPILSKKDLMAHDVAKTSLRPFIGSGPYKIKNFDQGNFIQYERVKDWWGKDLPINKGSYNFDTIKYVYFKDPTTAFEGFKSGAMDIRVENVGKIWASEYDFPLISQGAIIKDAIPNHANQGFQGLELNLRNPLLQDINLRKALALAYDFHWVNKHLFFNLYKRSKSYFENSDLASTATPTPYERELLQDKPHFLNDKPLISDHSTKTKSRQMFALARKILHDAGYKTRKDSDGQPRLYSPNGQPVRLTLLLQGQEYTKAYGKFQQDLAQWLGIELIFKIPADMSIYTRLLNKFEYDMVLVRIGQSESPGNEQINMWGSASAKAEGSQNYSGIASPLVDKILQAIEKAKSREELVGATKALDRALVHMYIGIPGYYNDHYWLAYKAFIKKPKITPVITLTYDTWWVDKK